MGASAPFENLHLRYDHFFLSIVKLLCEKVHRFVLELLQIHLDPLRLPKVRRLMMMMMMMIVVVG